MKDVTVEELKQRFIVRDVAPYGQVIVVPGADFDPDWEAVLEDQGHGCVFTDINNEKFVLVKLEKEEGGEETAAKPEIEREDSGQFAKHRGAQAGQKVNPWTEADEERLLKRMGELPGTVEEIVALLISEFPGRTVTGLVKKYQKLKRKMKGKPRIGRPKKVTQILEDAAIPKGDIEDLPGRAERVAAAGAQLDIVKTLAKVEDMVQKDHSIIIRLNCAIVMQALETEERRGLLTIPPKLREHYVDTLLKTWDDKVVETFLDKVHALLEASS